MKVVPADVCDTEMQLLYFAFLLLPVVAELNFATAEVLPIRGGIMIVGDFSSLMGGIIRLKLSQCFQSMKR